MPRESFSTMSRIVRHLYSAAGIALLPILGLFVSAQTSKTRPLYLSYNDAQPVLSALAEALPAELKGRDSSELARIWPNWIVHRDAEIRARLALGDEDSLVNFLLFGTSYTRQPRITSKEIAQVAEAANEPSANGEAATSPISKILHARADDLIHGLVTPGNNERLLFARLLLERKGLDPSTAAGRVKVREYLLASVSRVLTEQASYARALAAARLLGDPSEEFAERSRLYRSRGLSSDTSILPNFALEESLKAMLSRGLVKPGSMTRIAVVGPGLDFTDKQDGYDFYSQQTIQPFAIIDTLLRLGLATPETIHVTTFDLSPRVNYHLARAKHRAQRGESYVVQLPRDPQADWKAGLVRYWETFGNKIGAPVAPITVPARLSSLKVRAVRIRPSIVSRVTPEDLNIVLQRPDISAAQRFDLIIGTNIFL